MTYSVPRRLAATAALACGALPAATAHAGALNSVQLLDQDQFRQLSEDVGSVAAYKPLIPAESTGITGFDIGVGIAISQLKNRAVFEAASSNEDAPAALTQYIVRANKGLPFDLDIGASAATVQDTNIQIYGGEIRWAAVLGGTFIPAVSLRAAISNISGVDQMDLNTASIDISISKGFAFITPYAGIGQVQVKSTPTTNNGRQEETFNLTRVSAGTNIAIGLFNVVVEVDRTGDAANIGVKGGIRF